MNINLTHITKIKSLTLEMSTSINLPLDACRHSDERFDPGSFAF
jgi:hypothetical protein